MDVRWTIESFFQTLREHDERIAIIVDSGTFISYRELLNCVAYNTSMLNRRIQPHHAVIMIDLSLSWKVIPIMLAAFRLHITVIVVDPARDAQGFRHMTEKFPHALRMDATNVNATGHIRRPLLLHGTMPVSPQLQGVALIVRTSGTSGRPKSVMLTRANILSNIEDIASSLQLECSERLLIQRPLSYVSALCGELLAGLLVGCSILVKPYDRTPLSLLPLIREHAITTIGATPTLLAMLAPHARRQTCSSLRRIILSGERLTDAQLKTIRSGFPDAVIFNAYGLSEASPRISCLNLGTGDFPAACVGHPLNHVNIAIIDEHGQPMPDGTIGQLIVSGPNIMKGYYNDAAMTERKIRNGWLYTGDMAVTDQGRITIMGRADNLMIRAGMNVYPEEVESLLTSHPSIHEALAFSSPHPMRGEQIHVWVTCSESLTVADIHQFIIQSGSPNHLWPDHIEIHPQLPKTASGKLRRDRLQPPIA
ncbi:class I adenylate-forming enzyme family protein [Paenibacillus sp. SYP-B4298]|uniref:class I adenylate-forming enzyme family protein n=1 Tax=Paenibacillus sp. SYP-B4298 TaxID=2996034 RepID=UPI0022DDEB96|nr:fatty acid--CoA ligase family protein [Paenibacillus sp. SYP-B4298]